MKKINSALKSSVAESFSKAINYFPENLLFLSLCTLILLLPMIATIGQFYNTGFFLKSAPLLIFYWPGSDFEIKIPVLVWVSMGLIFISYLAGITFMLKK